MLRMCGFETQKERDVWKHAMTEVRKRGEMSKVARGQIMHHILMLVKNLGSN